MSDVQLKYLSGNLPGEPVDREQMLLRAIIACEAAILDRRGSYTGHCLQVAKYKYLITYAKNELRIMGKELPDDNTQNSPVRVPTEDQKGRVRRYKEASQGY